MNIDFENVSLGTIRETNPGQIWNVVQISDTEVRLWKGLNDSVFLSLQFYKDSISEGRFRRVD